MRARDERHFRGRSPLRRSPTFHQPALSERQRVEGLSSGGSPWSAGPLEIGLSRALHVREERLSARHDACRLLYVSDIHLRNGRSDTLCRQVLDAVTRCNPDVVLLGGDLVDRPSELSKLSDLVGRLREVAPVLAIGGNHDQRIGMNRVREAVVHGGGQWIHDGIARVTHGGRVIAVSGPDSRAARRWACPRPVRAQPANLEDVPPRRLRPRPGRAPAWLPAGRAANIGDRLFPGAIFYPYCFLSHQRGSTRLVVSRGVSDLVPIRWRCPREVVLCHV